MNNIQLPPFDLILLYSNNLDAQSNEEKKESCPSDKGVTYRFNPVITPNNFVEKSCRKRKGKKEKKDVSIPKAQEIIRSNGNAQVNNSNANESSQPPSLPLNVEFQSKEADQQIIDPSFHWAVLPDISGEISLPNESEQLFAQGKALELQGRYDEAFQKFKIAGDKGHAESIQCVTIYYQAILNLWINLADLEQEKGNDAGTFYYYQMAAQCGHSGAQNRLGLYYSIGQGNSDNLPDWENAFLCFQAAAALGHRDAACNLGACYENGKGVLQNYSNAAKSYHQAGQHKAALYKLALLYKDGKGVEQNVYQAISLLKDSAKIAYKQNDLKHAYVCIELAASLGDLESSTLVSLSYLKKHWKT